MPIPTVSAHEVYGDIVVKPNVMHQFQHHSCSMPISGSAHHVHLHVGVCMLTWAYNSLVKAHDELYACSANVVLLK